MKTNQTKINIHLFHILLYKSGYVTWNKQPIIQLYFLGTTKAYHSPEASVEFLFH